MRPPSLSQISIKNVKTVFTFSHQFFINKIIGGFTSKRQLQNQLPPIPLSWKWLSRASVSCLFERTHQGYEYEIAFPRSPEDELGQHSTRTKVKNKQITTFTDCSCNVQTLENYSGIMRKTVLNAAPCSFTAPWIFTSEKGWALKGYHPRARPSERLPLSFCLKGRGRERPSDRQRACHHSLGSQLCSGFRQWGPREACGKVLSTQLWGSCCTERASSWSCCTASRVSIGNPST